MSTNLRSVSGFIFCCVALLSPSPAQAQWGRVYTKVDLGGTVVADTELKEFLGPVASNSTVEFDPGFRFGIAMGYQVTDWFSGEVETGYMYNSIASITDSSGLDASYSNVPFLVNGRLQWPNRSRLTPYCGAGVGFTASLLDANYITVGDVTLVGSETEFVFAWQAFAGLRYQFNDNMGLSVEFHYFWADSTEWTVDVTYGTFSNKIRFGDTQTYVATIAFQYRF